jgi:2-isopropylmalate synthase
MKTEYHLDLPRRLQIDFSAVIQRHTDSEGGEVSPQEMWGMFQAEYLTPSEMGATSGVQLDSHHTSSAAGALDELSVNVIVDGQSKTLTGTGNGPIAAFCDALSSIGVDVRVLDYHEHAMSAGGDARAAAYLECAVGGQVKWGVGIDANIVTASLKAVCSAINR